MRASELIKKYGHTKQLKPTAIYAAMINIVIDMQIYDLANQGYSREESLKIIEKSFAKSEG